VKILLDGVPIDKFDIEDATLETTLRRVQTARCPPSRMVVGIRCDDRDIVGDDMTARLGEPTSNIGTLEVFTSTRQELVIGALAQAASALQNTESASRHVAELLSAGKTTEGIKTLGECLSVWQQIHEAITKSIAMLELDIASMTIRDQPILEVLAKPRDVLTQLKQALTAQDNVLLADVLRYEFGEVIDQWYSIIATIRQHAEDQRDEDDQTDPPC